MEFNSLSSRSFTIGGKTSPYISWAFLWQISLKVWSEFSMTGGHLSGRTGAIFSHISAILLGFVITISSAFSLPRYSNSFSISSVVRKYKGAWLSASLKPFPAIIIRRYTSSSGFKKCTSQVPTTSL